MPPSKKRRVSGQAAPKKQQPTLSFRPTKSGIVAPSLQTITEYEPEEKPAKVSEQETTDEIVETHEIRPSPRKAKPEVAPAQQEQDTDDEEEDDYEIVLEKAKKISRKQVETYWKEKEKARTAPRVHQQDLSVGEKILREWDLSSHYGPSIGISRQRRWERAHNLDMNPPIEVLAVLVNGEKLNLAGGRRSSGKGNAQGGEHLGQKSILDELIMSSKVSATARDVGVEA